jgi:hypothetical protein
VPLGASQVGGGPLQHPRGQCGVSQLSGGHCGGAAGGRLQWGSGGVYGASVGEENGWDGMGEEWATVIISNHGFIVLIIYN